jgi:uncharacterized protein YqcC (DUF446 family)
MHDIPDRIADVLLEVEANLRTSGQWEKKQPPMSALTSAEPFCIDTLRFQQWLQWIFLPRMKQIIEEQQPLPARSGIYEYAEETLCRKKPREGRLLSLIKTFDELIRIQSAAIRH